MSVLKIYLFRLGQYFHLKNNGMKKKQSKKRASKYEKKLKIDGTFDQAIKALFKEPKDKKSKKA